MFRCRGFRFEAQQEGCATLDRSRIWNITFIQESKKIVPLIEWQVLNIDHGKVCFSKPAQFLQAIAFHDLKLTAVTDHSNMLRTTISPFAFLIISVPYAHAFITRCRVFELYAAGYTSLNTSLNTKYV